ncbi:Trm112 family protein [Nocardioides perillae]|uniref:UPF0434 protein BJ989_001506 n=1 Tax=Nocardioides perillae TaxID=1119534 RepID=A0A7Y9RV74_9ACTN|nr:hypothetical protein [Nocardioides perillae]
MPIPPDLLALVVCPGCRADLEPAAGPAGEEELVCTGCGNAYPVRDDIPVLLLDEARRRS